MPVVYLSVCIFIGQARMSAMLLDVGARQVRVTLSPKKPGVVTYANPGLKTLISFLHYPQTNAFRILFNLSLDKRAFFTMKRKREFCTHAHVLP